MVPRQADQLDAPLKETAQDVRLCPAVDKRNLGGRLGVRRLFRRIELRLKARDIGDRVFDDALIDGDVRRARDSDLPQHDAVFTETGGEGAGVYA